MRNKNQDSGAVPDPKTAKSNSHGIRDEHIANSNPIVIEVITYGADRLEQKTAENLESIRQDLRQDDKVWIRIESPHDTSWIKELGPTLGLHDLAVEDLMADHQRTRLTQYGDTFSLAVQIIENKGSSDTKQLNALFNDRIIVTFQRHPLALTKVVQSRLNNDEKAIRAKRIDHIVYLILDTTIDSYFPILEQFGEKLDDLEQATIKDPSRKTMAAIHRVKRQLLMTRRASWPLRDAVNSLIRDAGFLLNEDSRIHLRDCYHEIVRVIEFIETYRELGSDLMDVYLSSVSNRLNEIMKVLTIITVVFAPPTLIAAIYGMNFNPRISPFNLPELNWYYGYPYALTLMLCTSLFILALLWWRGFIGPFSNQRKTTRIDKL